MHEYPHLRRTLDSSNPFSSFRQKKFRMILLAGISSFFSLEVGEGLISIAQAEVYSQSDMRGLLRSNQEFGLIADDVFGVVFRSNEHGSAEENAKRWAERAFVYLSSPSVNLNSKETEQLARITQVAQATNKKILINPTWALSTLEELDNPPPPPPQTTNESSKQQGNKTELVQPRQELGNPPPPPPQTTNESSQQQGNKTELVQPRQPLDNPPPTPPQTTNESSQQQGNKTQMVQPQQPLDTRWTNILQGKQADGTTISGVTSNNGKLSFATSEAATKWATSFAAQMEQSAKDNQVANKKRLTLDSRSFATLQDALNAAHAAAPDLLADKNKFKEGSSVLPQSMVLPSTELSPWTMTVDPGDALIYTVHTKTPRTGFKFKGEKDALVGKRAIIDSSAIDSGNLIVDSLDGDFGYFLVNNKLDSLTIGPHKKDSMGQWIPDYEAGEGEEERYNFAIGSPNFTMDGKGLAAPSPIPVSFVGKRKREFFYTGIAGPVALKGGDNTISHKDAFANASEVGLSGAPVDDKDLSKGKKGVKLRLSQELKEPANVNLFYSESAQDEIHLGKGALTATRKQDVQEEHKKKVLGQFNGERGSKFEYKNQATGKQEFYLSGQSDQMKGEINLNSAGTPSLTDNFTTYLLGSDKKDKKNYKDVQFITKNTQLDLSKFDGKEVQTRDAQFQNGTTLNLTAKKTVDGKEVSVDHNLTMFVTEKESNDSKNPNKNVGGLGKYVLEGGPNSTLTFKKGQVDGKVVEGIVDYYVHDSQGEKYKSKNIIGDGVRIGLKGQSDLGKGSTHIASGGILDASKHMQSENSVTTLDVYNLSSAEGGTFVLGDGKDAYLIANKEDVDHRGEWIGSRNIVFLGDKKQTFFSEIENTGSMHIYGGAKISLSDKGSWNNAQQVDLENGELNISSIAGNESHINNLIGGRRDGTKADVLLYGKTLHIHVNDKAAFGGTFYGNEKSVVVIDGAQPYTYNGDSGKGYIGTFRLINGAKFSMGDKASLERTHFQMNNGTSFNRKEAFTLAGLETTGEEQGASPFFAFGKSFEITDTLNKTGLGQKNFVGTLFSTEEGATITYNASGTLNLGITGNQDASKRRSKDITYDLKKGRINVLANSDSGKFSVETAKANVSTVAGIEAPSKPAPTSYESLYKVVAHADTFIGGNGTINYLEAHGKAHIMPGFTDKGIDSYKGKYDEVLTIKDYKNLSKKDGEATVFHININPEQKTSTKVHFDYSAKEKSDPTRTIAGNNQIELQFKDGAKQSGVHTYEIIQITNALTTDKSFSFSNNSNGVVGTTEGGFKYLDRGDFVYRIQRGATYGADNKGNKLDPASGTVQTEDQQNTFYVTSALRDGKQLKAPDSAPAFASETPNSSGRSPYMAVYAAAPELATQGVLNMLNSSVSSANLLKGGPAKQKSKTGLSMWADAIGQKSNTSQKIGDNRDDLDSSFVGFRAGATVELSDNIALGAFVGRLNIKSTVSGKNSVTADLASNVMAELGKVSLDQTVVGVNGLINLNGFLAEVQALYAYQSGTLDRLNNFTKADLKGHAFGWSGRAMYQLSLGDSWILAPLVGIRGISSKLDPIAAGTGQPGATYDSVTRWRAEAGALVRGTIDTGQVVITPELAVSYLHNMNNETNVKINNTSYKFEPLPKQMVQVAGAVSATMGPVVLSADGFMRMGVGTSAKDMPKAVNDIGGAIRLNYNF